MFRKRKEETEERRHATRTDQVEKQGEKYVVAP